MNTQVITISNRIPHEPYYFYHQFLASCERNKIKPHFLPGEWRGLLSKPKLLLKYLESTSTVEPQYTIVTDCWDIIFLAGTDEILEKYKAFNSPIVFNAERSCFPRGDLWEFFPVSVTPYRFLNSGFFVGETQAIVEMLKQMHLDTLPDDHTRPDGSKWEPNDQEYYQLWFLEHTKNAALDNAATICQSLHNTEADEFSFDVNTRRLKSSVTHNEPSVVHGNGSGKEWLKKIIYFLGL